MATTLMTNMINPQVMGDMIEAKIAAQLKFIPYAKVDTTLQGNPGDTKRIPKWGFIGNAGDQAENTALNYTAMSATFEDFTIKKISKGVELTSEAINSGYGDPVGTVETQLTKAIMGKVNADVLAKALESHMVYNGLSAIIGYKPIVSAVGKFADEEDGIEKVMFIHPEQETQLLKDSDFISADKFTAGVAVNGAIGKIAGCWIKKSLLVPKVDAVTAVQGVYKAKIATKAASGDKIKVNGVTLTAGTDFLLTTDTATGNAAAIATALNSSSDTSVTPYTWSSSGTYLIATEDSGKEGTGIFTVEVTQVASTGTMVVDDPETTTAGVAAEVAKYVCPIIKMEIDSAETEYTDTELPALTIFLKKGTDVHVDYDQDYDKHKFAAYRYYGVALTNEAKVVVAKFAQTA